MFGSIVLWLPAILKTAHYVRLIVQCSSCKIKIHTSSHTSECFLAEENSLKALNILMNSDTGIESTVHGG